VVRAQLVVLSTGSTRNEAPDEENSLAKCVHVPLASVCVLALPSAHSHPHCAQAHAALAVR
jgi:hypothetical protein